MLKRLALTTALTLTMAFSAQAQEPRRGGTIRFTAPYAASFVSNDSHVSNQIQDEIYGYALHRALYKWDSTNNKPVLELAKSVTTSADGTVHQRSAPVWAAVRAAAGLPDPGGRPARRQERAPRTSGLRRLHRRPGVEPADRHGLELTE